MMDSTFVIKGKGKRRQDITKNLLEELYIKNKLSMYKIAKKLNTTSRTIWKKLRKYDIKARTISEANTKYPKPTFSGNLTEKAYMMGLRTGDVSTKRNGRRIMVYTSTTHVAQYKMFQDTFGKYTHKIYSYIGSTPKNGIAWKISCNLHETFDFLVNKLNEIPAWILQNTKLFFTFLAGYSDCEGCWKIGRQKTSKKIGLRFSIKSGDKIILEQIKNKLIDMNFKVNFYLSRIAKDYGYNKDMYSLEICHKEGIIKLAKFLLKFSLHDEKIWKMKFILDNYKRNWEEIKNKIENFREQIKQTTLSSDNRNSKVLLPFHLHDDLISV